MNFDAVQSTSSDRREQPPAWILDVLSDLQKVADKKGLVRFSGELRRIRSGLPQPPQDC